MFLHGRIVTSDGTPVPYDVTVERVCSLRLRQQVYASTTGDFNMQLGSRTDSVSDGDLEYASPAGTNARDTSMGIPRSDLRNCELRASASGFRTAVKPLDFSDLIEANVDVGVVSLERMKKVEGMTVNAASYNIPKDARKAYEKGLDAQKNGKLLDARKNFEAAVRIYPRYANAWSALGTVLRKDNQNEAARDAFTRATTIDSKFVPAFVSLASIAFEAENWTDVLNLTNHVANLDVWDRVNAKGYVLDMDSPSFVESYFYNAFANFRLHRLDEAEKSGLKAERHINAGDHFPQLHLLMADIYTKRSNCSSAATELRTFLELLPHAPNADHVHEQLARLQACQATGSLPAN
jgi:tetratricopeptide (TPR) repeat protein